MPNEKLDVSCLFSDRERYLSFYFTLRAPRIVFYNSPSPSIFICEVLVIECSLGCGPFRSSLPLLNVTLDNERVL